MRVEGGVVGVVVAGIGVCTSSLLGAAMEGGHLFLMNRLLQTSTHPLRVLTK